MSSYTPVSSRLSSPGIKDCFEAGNLVSCITCFDKVVQGEVMAFDAPKKLLVLKCPASNGLASANNVEIINLSYVKDIRMVKESRSAPKFQERIDTDKLHTRVKRAVEEKRRIVNAMSGGNNDDGRNLFLTISKTIKDISWKDQDIVVFQDAMVVIAPPYRPDNVKGNADDKGYKQIRKIVEKHFADLEKVNPRPDDDGCDSNKPVKKENESSTVNTDEDSVKKSTNTSGHGNNKPTGGNTNKMGNNNRNRNSGGNNRRKNN